MTLQRVAESAGNPVVGNLPAKRAWRCLVQAGSADEVCAVSKYVGFSALPAGRFGQDHRPGRDSQLRYEFRHALGRVKKGMAMSDAAVSACQNRWFFRKSQEPICSNEFLTTKRQLCDRSMETDSDQLPR